MSLVNNPKDLNTIIEFDGVIKEIKNETGYIYRSGLFRKEFKMSTVIMKEIEQDKKFGGLGVTSRRAREKVKTQRTKAKQVTFAIPYVAMVDQVSRDDLAGRAVNWQTASEETVLQMYTDRLTNMKRHFDESFEFFALTGSQGRTRDLGTGDIILDMFEQLGQTQETLGLDLTDNTVNVHTWMSELRNRLIRINGADVGVVEVIVDQATYNKIVSHPSVTEAFVMAYQTRGAEYLNKTAIVGNMTPSAFGYTSWYEFEGVRFVVLPTYFLTEEGEEVKPVEAGKGYTICRGARDVYTAAFAPDNTLDGLGKPSAEIYAWRSEIKDRTYFEFTMESAPIFYMNKPRLCIDITFTL